MHSTNIKKWLKQNGKNRAWLATQCGVKPPTVDGWLSAGRPIPGPALRIIEQLMNERLTINPKLSLSDYQRVTQRAEAEGITPMQWIERAIIKSLMFAIFGGIVYLLA